MGWSSIFTKASVSAIAAPAATCDIACVFGTRPEAVKLVSVVEALRAAGASVHVIATGQHTTLLDRALVARLGVAEALDKLAQAEPWTLVPVGKGQPPKTPSIGASAGDGKATERTDEDRRRDYFGGARVGGFFDNGVMSPPKDKGAKEKGG